MATKTVHTVTLPDGTTAKRTSTSRVYSHAVAVGPTKREVVAARLEESMKYNLGKLNEYRSVVDRARAGSLQLVMRLHYGATEPDGTEWWETAGRSVSIWPNRVDRKVQPIRDLAHAQELAAERYQEYADDTAKGLERLAAELEATKTGPELVGKWYVAGWQSRPDLAASAQGTAAKHHPGCEVIILEAQRA